MFTKTFGSMMAFGICAVATLSAFDAEAGWRHRHHRASCCNNCPTTCCEPVRDPCCDPCAGTMVSYVAPAAPCCGTVVREVIVSSCCLASSSPSSATSTIAEKEESQPESRTAALPVSASRLIR